MNGSPHDPHRRGTDRLDDMLSSTDDQPTAEYPYVNPHQQAPQYSADAGGGWGGQPGYPAGGYARPPEYEPQKPRRGAGFWAPIAIILLSLLALAAVWFLTRSGSDGDKAPSDAKSTSQQQDPSSDSGDAGTATSDPSTEQPTDPSPSSPPLSSAAATLDANLVREYCDGGTQKVGVPKGNGTSCEFANNVAAQVRAQGAQAGSFTVTAWSPKTEETITVSCQPGTFVTCTGGRSAVIYVVP